MQKIIVIDDEKYIGEGIVRLLAEANYESRAFCEQSPALKYLLSKERADLILLDVWMPEMDGYAFLKKIQDHKITTPVIVMSGHANVALSTQTLKNGAADFLEKPFTPEMLLYKIKNVLKNEPNDAEPNIDSQFASPDFNLTSIPQRTLKKSIVLKGIGLHSGRHTGLILSPLPPGSGIIFEDIATTKTMQARSSYVSSAQYATTLQNSEFKVSVIEHLMAALHIYGIDNIKIKVSHEVPILDGSALPFCEALEEAGFEDQDTVKKIFIPQKSYQIIDDEDKTKTIELTPYDGLKISYTLDLPKEYGHQYHEIEFTRPGQEELFKREIAPCRTFGFLEETRHLQSSGMALGATLENGILLHENRVVNLDLRFPNEFARHKIIDILGDFYLLGSEMRGKITAHATGHRHNVALVKKILNTISAPVAQ